MGFRYPSKSANLGILEELRDNIATIPWDPHIFYNREGKFRRHESELKRRIRLWDDQIMFLLGWKGNFTLEEYLDYDEEIRNGACWYDPEARPYRDKWIDGHYRPSFLTDLEEAMQTIDWAFPSWTIRFRRVGGKYRGILGERAQPFESRPMESPAAALMAAFVTFVIFMEKERLSLTSDKFAVTRGIIMEHSERETRPRASGTGAPSSTVPQ